MPAMGLFISLYQQKRARFMMHRLVERNSEYALDSHHAFDILVQNFGFLT